MKTVKFKSIGRENMSWEVRTSKADEIFFYRQLKEKKALHSSDIELEVLLEQPKTTTLRVWVDGIITVGLIEVVNDET